MKKPYLFLLLLIILLIGFAAGRFSGYIKNTDKVKNDDVSKEPLNIISKPDPLNTTYDVEGDIFTLVNGRAELAIEDSSEKSLLTIYGGPVYGDLDGDGDTDAALWLANDPGGSGKFYYAAFVMNNGTDTKATSAFFLGDRIVPQSLTIENGKAVYTLLERKPDDPMTAEPSVKHTFTMVFDKEKNEIIEYAE